MLRDDLFRRVISDMQTRPDSGVNRFPQMRRFQSRNHSGVERIPRVAMQQAGKHLPRCFSRACRAE